MTQVSIVHEFKEGSEGGTAVENYWMWANFEALTTGAIYCAEIDDDQIRKYCTILNADPDLLNDFLVVKPNINVLPQAVMAEFTLKLGSKTYGFIVQIPKFTHEGSLTEVVELHQKNNVLTRRIKTLEERITQQEKNSIMFANLCAQLCFYENYADANGYIQCCIEIAGDDNIPPHRYNTMVNHIETYDKVGIRLIELLKNEKLPKLKDHLISKRKEIYPRIMGHGIDHIQYVDKILQFCQLEIEIDHDIVQNEWCCIPNETAKKLVKQSMLELFNHQVTVVIPSIASSEIQTIIKSPDFAQKCSEIRILLIKLSKK